MKVWCWYIEQTYRPELICIKCQNFEGEEFEGEDFEGEDFNFDTCKHNEKYNRQLVKLPSFVDTLVQILCS